MKIEKFLTWIQDKLLNYPDISLTTLKMFIDKFQCCLSKREKERWQLSIQMIKEYTSKQMTIDSVVQDIKIENLSNELEKLKNNDDLE